MAKRIRLLEGSPKHGVAKVAVSVPTRLLRILVTATWACQAAGDAVALDTNPFLQEKIVVKAIANKYALAVETTLEEFRDLFPEESPVQRISVPKLGQDGVFMEEHEYLGAVTWDYQNRSEEGFTLYENGILTVGQLATVLANGTKELPNDPVDVFLFLVHEPSLIIYSAPAPQLNGMPHSLV